MTSDIPVDKGYKYVPEDRAARAMRIADEINSRVGLVEKRVLDIGCHQGEISTAMAARYGCEVVGLDVEAQSNWEAANQTPGVHLQEGDIADEKLGLPENSFDRIVSISTFEHIWHPWSALQQCQRYLKPDGKFYLFSMLYRSAGASHLINRLEDRWPHLLLRRK